MIYRGWINQPSNRQPLHTLHGARVIIEDPDPRAATVRVWFATGDIISMQVMRSNVSNGNPAS